MSAGTNREITDRELSIWCSGAIVGIAAGFAAAALLVLLARLT